MLKIGPHSLDSALVVMCKSQVSARCLPTWVFDYDVVFVGGPMIAFCRVYVIMREIARSRGTKM